MAAVRRKLARVAADEQGQTLMRTPVHVLSVDTGRNGNRIVVDESWSGYFRT